MLDTYGRHHIIISKAPVNSAFSAISNRQKKVSQRTYEHLKANREQYIFFQRTKLNFGARQKAPVVTQVLVTTSYWFMKALQFVILVGSFVSITKSKRFLRRIGDEEK